MFIDSFIVPCDELNEPGFTVAVATSDSGIVIQFQ